MRSCPGKCTAFCWYHIVCFVFFFAQQIALPLLLQELKMENSLQCPKPRLILHSLKVVRCQHGDISLSPLVITSVGLIQHVADGREKSGCVSITNSSCYIHSLRTVKYQHLVLPWFFNI